MKPKIMRVTASPFSLDVLLAGQLRRLSSRYDIVGVASPDEAVHERIRRREGIRTVQLPIERKISPLKDLRSLVELYALFRRERPQIVHSLTPKAGLLSMAAARMAGVPARIHTFTGLVFPWRRGMVRRLLRTTDRLICALATHVIPEGEGVKRDLVRHRITRKPLEVLANGHVSGIDTELFKPSPRTDSGSVVRFVFVGRIVRDKGIEELRAAFERMTGAELILVGPFEQELDPLDNESFEWAKGGKGVKNAGYQEDIRPFLAAADVFVLPSHREGFPGTPLQAGAMGLPSIVTDICGCNEIVVDGETGLVVEPRNPEGLHVAMERLAADPGLRRKMGANARRRVVEKFSQERVQAALTEFYDYVSKSL